MVWSYEYLLSCPGVLILGYPKYRGLEGVVTLTVLYPRINVLGRGGTYKVVGDVPEVFNGGRVRGICMDLARGVEGGYGFIDEVVRQSMYMGGLNIFLKHGGGAVLVSSEIVDDKRIHIYHTGRGIVVKGFRESRLEDWIILATGLRLGEYQLVYRACEGLGRVEGQICKIDTPTTTLVLSPGEIHGENHHRVVVDNNGLRNVIKV